MKKKLKFKIVIMLIAILLLLVPIITKASIYSDSDLKNNRNYVFSNDSYGDESHTKNNHFVEIKVGNEIAVYVNGTSPESKPHVNTLSLPNVYCLNNGVNAGWGSYKITSVGNKASPLLAYILAQGPTMGQLESNYKNDPSQQALWYYISKSNSSEASFLRGSLGCNSGSPSSKALEYYNDAVAYSNKVNNSIFNIFRAKVSNILT